MKIAYVITDYTASGGMERVLTNKVNYLVQKGYDISIIAYKHNDKAAFFKFDDRVNFYHLPAATPSVFHIGKSHKINWFVEQIEAQLKEIKPDITVAMAYDLGFYVYRSKDGSKKVIESHFSKYRSKLIFYKLDKFPILRIIPEFYKRKENNCLRYYERFVLLTNEDREMWKRYNNTVIIPNFIDFTPSQLSNTKKKRVIAIGRLVNQKGFDVLIDIWRNIAYIHPTWELVLIGEGKKRDLLVKKIKRYGLEKSVYIKEPTHDIQKEFIDSSVYVMTSRYEGFGLAMAEGMLCGLPAVAFSCKCGPKDIVTNDKDGFLIESDNKQLFTERLSMLLSDDKLRHEMGKRAAYNMQRFSKETVMAQWLSLFKQLSEQDIL